MLLCARSTSRSREQSTNRRSHSENMWKVCLFFSQNNKIVWLSNMADTFLRNLRCAQRFVGFCSWLCLSDADWLGRQTPITWQWLLARVFLPQFLKSQRDRTEGDSGLDGVVESAQFYQTLRFVLSARSLVKWHIGGGRNFCHCFWSSKIIISSAIVVFCPPDSFSTKFCANKAFFS